jgi:hypothetical protein
MQRALLTMGLILAFIPLLLLGAPAQTIQWTKTGWQLRLNRHEMLIARGDKARDYVYTRKNLRTGQERPIIELNRWFLWWNHHFICFSPDGRWAVWRDRDGILIAASLDGRRKRLIWADWGWTNDPIFWLSDSRQFFVLSDFSEDPKGSGQWRAHVRELFDLRSPGSRKMQKLSKEEAERLLKLPRRSPFS